MQSEVLSDCSSVLLREIWHARVYKTIHNPVLNKSRQISQLLDPVFLFVPIVNHLVILAFSCLNNMSFIPNRKRISIDWFRFCSRWRIQKELLDPMWIFLSVKNTKISTVTMTSQIKSFWYVSACEPLLQPLQSISVSI